MKSLMLALLAAFSLNVAAGSSNVDGAKAKLDEYFDAFNSGDIQKIATEIYATPVQMVVPQGRMVLATPEEAIRGLTGFRKGLEAAGFAGFRFDNVEVCELSDSLVLLDTHYYTLLNKGPKTIEAPSTLMYVMSKTDAGWRIVAYYDHAHENRPSCG